MLLGYCSIADARQADRNMHSGWVGQCKGC